MRRVKLGIIGCGVIGKHHIAAAKACDHIDLVAIADLKKGMAQELADQHGIPKVYGEGADLLADRPVEGVVIAFPAVGRFDMALKAIKHGIHFITEKPVAMNAGQVRKLIQAKGKLIAGCCSARYRFLESTRAITDFVAGGRLGPLRVLHCRAIRPGGPPPKSPPPEWRLKRELNGGGILANWGCYDIDYLLGITGWSVRPKTAFATLWNVPPRFESLAAPGSNAETHLCATIRCSDNVAIHYERAEMAASKESLMWNIIGTNGSLDLHMTDRAVPVVFHGASPTTGVESEVIWDRKEEADPIHSGPIRDFAAAIAEGRPTKTPLEKAFVVQAITDAIYRSAEEQRSVDVEGL